MATRWLTEDQQKTWRAYLRASARIQQFLDADLRRSGLSLAEYEILVALSEAEGRRLRMSELSDAVHQSRSRLTHTVTRLEKAGQVSRSHCEADGRGVWAELTAAGYELLVASAPDHVEAVRHILVDQVSDEDYAALGRVMKAVLQVPDRVPAKA